jgi:hypothetical protein
MLWTKLNIWRRSRSFSIRSCCRPPIARRAGRGEIVLRWCVMPCESTCAAWKFERSRSAIARAIRKTRKALILPIGKGKQLGRQNNAG